MFFLYRMMSSQLFVCKGIDRQCIQCNTQLRRDCSNPLYEFPVFELHLSNSDSTTETFVRSFFIFMSLTLNTSVAAVKHFGIMFSAIVTTMHSLLCSLGCNPNFSNFKPFLLYGPFSFKEEKYYLQDSLSRFHAIPKPALRIGFGDFGNLLSLEILSYT